MKNKYIQPKSRMIEVRAIPLLSGSDTPATLSLGGDDDVPNGIGSGVGEAKSIFGTTYSDENVWGEMW